MNPKDFTSWLDGTASARLARKVEAQLADRAASEKENWHQIQRLLQEHLKAPPLPHPDWINAQVARALESAPPQLPLPPWRPWFWAGVGAVAAAAILAWVGIPAVWNPLEDDAFSSRVLSARGGSAQVSVSSFRTPEGRGMVLWVEGAGFIGPEEKVR